MIYSDRGVKHIIFFNFSAYLIEADFYFYYHFFLPHFGSMCVTFVGTKFELLAPSCVSRKYLPDVNFVGSGHNLCIFYNLAE